MTVAARPAPVELVRALAVLVEPPGPRHGALAELLELPGEASPEAWTALFHLELHPWASVHLGPEGMLGGEARDRVAGFWRALGLTPPAEPDHVGALLGLWAGIMERQEAAEDPARKLLWGQARSALLHEHLLSWLPPWLERVAELGSPFHAAWARLLRRVLADEAGSCPDAGVLSAHLRAAPALEDPRARSGAPRHDPRGGAPGARGTDPFLQELVTPVRTGFVLARSDLRRAAAEIGVGMRMGERTWILGALLAQDPAGSLEWLAREAHHRHGRRLRDVEDLGAPAAFWAERAAHSRDLLEELAEEARAAAAVPL